MKSIETIVYSSVELISLNLIFSNKGLCKKLGFEMTPPMTPFNDLSCSHLTTKNDALYQFSTTTQTTLPLTKQKSRVLN